MTQEEKFKKLLGYGWKHCRDEDAFSRWRKGKLEAYAIDEAWELERLLWIGAKRRIGEMLKTVKGLTPSKHGRSQP